MFRKKKELSFERRYPTSIDDVWAAWTDADTLRRWWGPEHTSIPECEVDLRVGGRVFIVTMAGEKMGKHAGTRWPLEATITDLDAPHRLAYDARSWTEGEDGSTIEHHNELTLAADGDATIVRLRVSITAVGPKAKLAAFGMKWGYKAQLDKLEKLVIELSGEQR